MVSSVPDAPTNVPLMMRALFESTNPVAATASPVKELSSEITTGMSAPPIGITMRTPNSSEPPSRVRNHGAPPPIAIMATVASNPTNTRTLAAFCAVERMAFSEMIPWSLPKAIRLPLNEIEPMMQPNMVETAAVAPGASPAEAACRYSAVEMSAAEPPPNPFSSATICGMSVICTRRAPTLPSTAPSAIPPRISP